jgi:hypothetical protein
MGFFSDLISKKYSLILKKIDEQRFLSFKKNKLFITVIVILFLKNKYFEFIIF